MARRKVSFGRSVAPNSEDVAGASANALRILLRSDGFLFMRRLGGQFPAETISYLGIPSIPLTIYA